MNSIKDFSDDYLIELSKLNLNIKEISNLLNVDSRRVSEKFLKLKIKTNSFGYLIKKNHNYFEKIDSEEKAYLLGYFIADGCISIEPKKKNGMIYSYNHRIMLLSSIDDLEVIQSFQKFISPETKIRYSNCQIGAKFRKPQCSIKFSSKKIVEDLIKKGINPRKTFEIDFKFDFNLIEEDLIHHFIRGFFDGDGGLINKGRSISFIFTSLLFTQQIKEIFEKLNLTTLISFHQCKNILTYKLVINGGYNKIKIIKDYLYKDATIYLKRKFDKFKIDN